MQAMCCSAPRLLNFGHPKLPCQGLQLPLTMLESWAVVSGGTLLPLCFEVLQVREEVSQHTLQVKLHSL